MANIHWSQNAHTVRVVGVNALILIPLLFWLMKLTSVVMFFIFIGTLTFFLVVENLMGLKPRYLPALIRYILVGYMRTPKTRTIDL